MRLFYRDFRHAFRALCRRKLYSFVAVSTFALGIGLNTAVFSIVDGVLLKPLSYPSPDRLVRVHQTSRQYRQSESPYLRSMWDEIPFSYADYQNLREQAPFFSDSGLYHAWNPVYTGSSEPIRLKGARVTPALLQALGVAPVIGRGLLEEDSRLQRRVILVSRGFWAMHLGRDPALQRTVQLDGEAFEVVGVMPTGFETGWPDQQVWGLIDEAVDELSQDRRRMYEAVARLADGVSIDQARRRCDRIAEHVAETHPDSDTGLRLVSLKESVVGDSKRLMYLLFGVAVAVLLIACVNIANLVLADNRARYGELALRISLGAGRSDIMRRVLAESLLLALAGVLAGSVPAFAAERAFSAGLAFELPRAANIVFDARVLAFSLLLGVLAALLSGLVPALIWSRSNPFQSLRAFGHAAGAGRWAPRTLAVVEIAVAFPLLVAAGLLANSFLRLSSIEPGLQTRGVVTQGVSLSEKGYDGPGSALFFSRLIEKLSGIPGVEAVGATSLLPLGKGAYTVGVNQPAKEPEFQSALLEQVSPAYFDVLEIPLLQGRSFRMGDTLERGRVLIVNETLARHFWPGGNPLQQSLSLAGSPPHRVIGVVQDVHHKGLDVAPEAKVYVPFIQMPAYSMTVVLKTSRSLRDLAATVRREVWSLDPNLPLAPASTMETILSHSLGEPRKRALLVGLMAGLACLLALVGVYGLMAFSVSSRRREMGIRLALGARRSQVRGMVLAETLRLAILGIVPGAALSLAGSQLLSGVLFQVTPADPATLAGVGLLIIVAALLAGFLPAFRASRTDPISVLRVE